MSFYLLMSLSIMLLKDSLEHSGFDGAETIPNKFNLNYGYEQTSWPLVLKALEIHSHCDKF